MAETGKKTCPVCDTTVAADARKCPSCDTDLTLFDIDMDGELDVDKIEISDESAIDDILSSIVGKDESSKLLEDIKSIGKESDMNEMVEEIEPEPTKVEEEPRIEEGGAFECPSCGSIVGADQTSCPNCGVEFEEQEILEFECPVCNAPVSATASSCDNCGVKFEAAGEEATTEEPEEAANGTASVEAATELEGEIEPAPEAELEEMKELEPVEEAPVPQPPEVKAPTLSDRLLAERQEKLKK
ncbi:MAG: zinc ribbon domain-containing protein, partial [Thermoplasmata archaeon]|nr:zinc ribbon domain-containing protein [Thermoplasmata archaeon]